VVLASGLLTQVALDQGTREDVLLVWLVPLYALAAWGVVQVVELVRQAVDRPLAATSVAVLLVTLVAAIGSVDLAKSVRLVPYDRGWARSGASRVPARPSPRFAMWRARSLAWAVTRPVSRT
jgi:hypothetical protein